MWSECREHWDALVPAQATARHSCMRSGTNRLFFLGGGGRIEDKKVLFKFFISVQNQLHHDPGIVV